MTPQQLSDLLVGIAKAQAAVLTAIEQVLDKSITHETRQAVQRINHAALRRGSAKLPITFSNLPTQLLEAALAPGSVSGREIENTAFSEISRLLSANG